MASSVKTIFKAAQVPIEWEQFDLTGYTTENVKDDSGKLRQAMDSIRKNKVALKGTLLVGLLDSLSVAGRTLKSLFAIYRSSCGFATRQ